MAKANLTKERGRTASFQEPLDTAFFNLDGLDNIVLQGLEDFKADIQEILRKSAKADECASRIMYEPHLKLTNTTDKERDITDNDFLFKPLGMIIINY